MRENEEEIEASKVTTPLPHCDICGKEFKDEDLTGKHVGIWFVICCEECKKKRQKVGRVVWEPGSKGRTK